MKQRILLLLFAFTSTLISQIKYVPDDYEIIQHAINDAEDGDTIIVEPGVYHQQINFKGKAITVASRYLLEPDTSYISSTIIDGINLPDRDSSSLIYFISGEDTNSILSGFTLQNGKGTYRYFPSDDWACKDGGAVYIRESGAKIINNIIRNNNLRMIDDSFDLTWAGGAGISCNVVTEEIAVIIDNNSFLNNSIQSGKDCAFGSAIDLGYISGSVVISRNKIIGNKVLAKASGYGGGICITDASLDSKVIIDNNYISHNTTFSNHGAAKGGGIACYFAAPTIRNNVIVYNEVKYPQNYSYNAFGGGIAVFWYKDLSDYYNVCENQYELGVNIENNTIAFNNDKLAGGGVALRSVTANLKNNIIGCNFSENNAQIKVEYPDAPETKSRTVKVEYCNVEGGVEGISEYYNGTGNINKFPEFTDEEHWYLKRDLSPCIDSGDPDEFYQDIEDSKNVGRACFPALGSRRNDIGAFGGPHSKWQEMAQPTGVEDLISTEIPNLPYLSQNYPNPFNPSTTIKYSIPKESVMLNSFQHLSDLEIPKQAMPAGRQVRDDNAHVVLKIYDILGSEIATLVNKNQKSGNYEVVWNASGIPSGVYFYELSYGAFIETKKLILLK